jgi:photosystem II stability/assembly factor-like uncharacterized protein
VIDPNVAGTVYLGTDAFSDGNSKGVLRSTDCGASWVHISTGENSDAINGGRQWTFAIDHVDSQVLYTNSGYFELGLFKSSNGGVDWTDVTPQGDGAPGFAGNLQMDPEDPEHLLLTWHALCSGPDGGLDPGVGCFAETEDGGATWHEHYGDMTWPGEVRVLLLHGSTWVVLGSELLYTTDGGDTYSPVPRVGGLGGHSSGTLSRASNGDFFIGTQVGIFHSPAESDGAQWSFLDNSGAWVGEIAETPTTYFATQQQGSIMIAPTGAVAQPWPVHEGSPIGCERIKYDAEHDVVYASCGANGFWRVVADGI